MRPGVFPRCGEPRDPRTRWTRRPGAYAILPLNGRLLLTFQDDDTPELQLPGGGIDPGEPIQRALHREVIEETGWRIGRPRRLGGFRRFTYMPEYSLHAEKICSVFVARPIRQISAPTEADHSILWMTPDAAIRALGNPGDRAIVAWMFGLPTPRSDRAAVIDTPFAG